MPARSFQISYRFSKGESDKKTPFVALPTIPKQEDATALVDKLRVDFPQAEWKLATLHTQKVIQTVEADSMTYPARMRLIAKDSESSGIVQNLSQNNT